MPFAVGGALVALLVIAGFLAYQFIFTVSFSLDGVAQRLPAGVTASELVSRGLVTKHPGDLISAKTHRVLTKGGGSAPYVSDGSTPLASSARIAAGEQLTSHDGTDAIEATRITTEPIDAPTHTFGSGPVRTVISQGKDGIAEVTVGVVSSEVVRRHVTKAAVATVVQLSALPTGGKVVALTFDDGPWPGSTEAVLNILKQYGVTATFFEIGQQVHAHPELSRKVAAAGMELGNHSWSHPLNIGRLSASGVNMQITQAESTITKVTGQRPEFFRPPGGNTAAAMYPVLSKLGMQWIQWDIDTEDWKRPPAAAIVKKVLTNVRNGSVVLMHDGGGDRSHTIQALPQIIVGLKAQGYTFVHVSDLKRIPHVMG